MSSGIDSSKEFRPATAADLRVVIGWIDSPQACFDWAGHSVRFPIDADTLEQDVALSRTRSWSSWHGDDLIGFGQLVRKGPEQLHLARLIVKPSRRGGGEGRALAGHLLREARQLGARSITLNVAEGNAAARHLYRELGFRRPVNLKPEGIKDYVPMQYVPESVRYLEREYFRQRGEASRPLDHWHFCDNEQDADDLAELVLAGRKRATSPSQWWFESAGLDLPRVGDAEIVTDWKGQARCVVEITAVAVVPFDEVDAKYARTEGEGDGSLDYWRKTHWDYYERELAGTAHSRCPDMPVVCIEFEVALVAKESRVSSFEENP